MDDQQSHYNQPSAPTPTSTAPPTIPQTPNGAGRSWAEISGQGTPPKRVNQARRAIILLPFLVLLIVGVWYGVGRYSTYSKRHSFESKIRNDAKSSSIPKAQAATTDTLLGQVAHGSGAADGIDIGVKRVVSDPVTAGDAPSSGMRYVEVDLSVKNKSNDSAIVPGTFYYRTADGKLLSTATSTGDKADYPNKDVRIADKESLDNLSLDSGQTDDSHYLIYQIPNDSKNGQLVWYDGYYDTNSTKLAVFNLD